MMTKKYKTTIELLQTLKATPERDNAQASLGKANFLAEAKRISIEPVSISWFDRLSNVFQTSRLQFSTLTIAILIGMIALGFSASVAAARQALPEQFLYPYKIWLENQRLVLTTRPESSIDLHLKFAETRLAELESIQTPLSETVKQQVMSNYFEHLKEADRLLAENRPPDNQIDRLHLLQTQIPDPDDGPDKEFDEDKHEGKGTQESEFTQKPIKPESPDDDDDNNSEHQETQEPEGDDDDEDPEETDDPDEPDDNDKPDDDDPDDDDSDESEKTDEPEETDKPDDEGDD
jgi:hypothetical protein